MLHQVFSGDQTPCAPLAFLPLLWRSSSSSSSLSEGYAQHDAHEVLVTCLSQIHANSRGSTNISCNCIIHSTFSGALASEVKCGKGTCSYTSVKVDPMMDISLQLKINSSGNIDTLGACLERYLSFLILVLILIKPGLYSRRRSCPKSIPVRNATPIL